MALQTTTGPAAIITSPLKVSHFLALQTTLLSFPVEFSKTIDLSNTAHT